MTLTSFTFMLNFLNDLTDSDITKKILEIPKKCRVNINHVTMMRKNRKFV